MVASGMRDAGYEYVNLDDCWMAPERDAQGRLQPDPERFPSGIKALADYVHARGLKLGIYEDVGTKTCAGFPGSYGHFEQDARTFAEWGVDFVKMDWCNVPFDDFPGLSQQEVGKRLYGEFAEAIKAAGRPMVLSVCVWNPAVEPWEFAPPISHMSRTNGDYGPTWPQILANLDQEADLWSFAGDGHWNDPDILMVGVGGLSARESRAHFSLWSLLAAPLLAGNDLRDMSPETREILTNREVIAIDQDPLGIQGRVLSNQDGLWVFAKPLAGGDVAVALFNETGAAARISTTAAAIGMPQRQAFVLRDLWQHTATETPG
jgi:alpha-galactosidase